MREWFRKLLGPYGPETKKVHLTFFLGSWALLAAIGLFIPEKVLSENEWAWRFSDFMASFIPQIDRITALNLRPEVNKFHYSILWAVSPVYFTITLSEIFRTDLKAKKQVTYGQAFGMFMASVWFIGFTMFLWGVNDPSNRIERLAFYYPFFRAAFAPLLVGGFWVFLTLIIYVIWGGFTGRFHRSPRSKVHDG